MAEFTISVPQAEFLIAKARAYDAKEGASDPDAGSNATDDRMIDVLADQGNDPVTAEIRGFVDALNDDEQIDLVTLLRLGRGEATGEEWSDLRAEVARSHDRRSVVSYLLGQPLLGDLLAEGLEEVGLPPSRNGEITPVA